MYQTSETALGPPGSWHAQDQSLGPDAPYGSIQGHVRARSTNSALFGRTVPPQNPPRIEFKLPDGSAHLINSNFSPCDRPSTQDRLNASFVKRSTPRDSPLRNDPQPPASLSRTAFSLDAQHSQSASIKGEHDSSFEQRELDHVPGRPLSTQGNPEIEFKADESKPEVKSDSAVDQLYDRVPKPLFDPEALPDEWRKRQVGERIPRRKAPKCDSCLRRGNVICARQRKNKTSVSIVSVW